MSEAEQSDILRSASEVGIAPVARPRLKLQDFLTISDTSIDTLERSTFTSRSALETRSLESSMHDGQTINPDSYGSHEEAASAQSEWLIIGQPDHHLAAEEDDFIPPSVITDVDSIDLEFDQQKKFAELHIQRRLKCVKRYLEGMAFCDLSLQFGASTTPVHATLFAMHEGFRDRFPGLLHHGQPTGKTRHLDVYGDVTVPAFAAIMNFVYDGQCEVAYENLAEIVTAAEFFGITALDEEISRAVDEVMIDTNLLPIIVHGDPDHPLHQVAWAKLLERIHAIAKLGDYIALEVGEICKILSADGLAVHSEYTVFEIAVKWIDADRFTRTVHFNKIISCVRFHFMTVEELSRCQREEDLLTTSKPIADIIALAYITRPFILENDLTFLENFELSPPRNLQVLRHFTSAREQSPRSENSSGGSLLGNNYGGSLLGNRSGGSLLGNSSGGSLPGNRSGGSLLGNSSGGSLPGNSSGGSLPGNSSGGSLLGNSSGGSLLGNSYGGSLFEEPQPKLPRFEWGRNKGMREPSAIPLESSTLDGCCADVREDADERRLSLKLESLASVGKSGEEIVRPRTRSLSVKLRQKSSRKLTPTAMDPRMSSRLCSAAGNGGSTTGSSPSFSEMTFNENGSLVTKRGGKEAHRTLNRAFERIYKEKPCSR
ncbi:hypothetical protein BV898_12683 [Hypsibius exemplaris]|uniref:BTB domain-containing protein n=1 Tax=Hypsibius exemplaris TaxID=2072580 RepID=A0A1W0WCS4_HYPEX|nr:hypothetical protein BV898_12683 [Hypsibius exemplaris]